MPLEQAVASVDQRLQYVRKEPRRRSARPCSHRPSLDEGIPRSDRLPGLPGGVDDQFLARLFKGTPVTLLPVGPIAFPVAP
jgi:hypothetical protein